ncbi:MAG: holo-ACP synthase, partial [Betaproteobacteria bacterium]|nr:holo-ACP synthase [Betaproteobacteria bacterium]
MIAGLGIDIVQTSRIREVFARYGLKFARRILAEGELARFANSRAPVSFLAMRFAAKEATSKALGTGFRLGVSPRLIEVEHNPAGKPSLRFHGAVAEHVLAQGVTASFVSLTDEIEYAAAVVVFER